jgi:two-component system phosphate regulon sensor histidine kinase PhoR
VKPSRSIVFYAWAGFGAGALLVAGVVGFVLTGASYQARAITALRERAQAAQVDNVTMQAVFLDSQRALGSYQATRRNRFLQTYYLDQDQFVFMLARLRRVAWRSALPGVTGQASAAQAAFLAGQRAIQTPAGSEQAGGLYELASAEADSFVKRSRELQQRIAAESNMLAAQSERTLGVGLVGTSTILAVGLLLPLITAAIALRWTTRPLYRITDMVRRRTHGDLGARLVAGGPADVRYLAASLNLLADEDDRLRSLESERAHLLEAVRIASTRIHQHLHAANVISEAVAAVEEHLGTDFAWVGLVSGEDLTLAEGDRQVWDQVAGVVGHLPPDSVGWMREIYQQHCSYCVQDLHSAEAEEIPAAIRKVLIGLGAASLLLTAFGAGPDLLGVITLLRNDPARPWSAAEIAAVESLAADIGRGLEHARLYESEQHLVSELRALDGAKTSFLASASHDLRTPLTSILGYVEILSDAEVGQRPETAKMLDAMARNIRRLQTLIEDMLTISTIELGKFTSQLHPVDLATVVPRAAEVIEPSAAEKEVAFGVDCPRRSLVVDGDAEQLDRVVINLLSNAVKYTPSHGSVKLTAAREGNYAVLTVADTGMGIPEQDQKSLFTPFFRASNAVSRAVPGSGLGLSIVHTVVSNHHGDVAVTSAEECGTTIVVRIPLLDVPSGWSLAPPVKTASA